LLLYKEEEEEDTGVGEVIGEYEESKKEELENK
jgi:hypothetical protein